MSCVDAGRAPGLFFPAAWASRCYLHVFGLTSDSFPSEQFPPSTNNLGREHSKSHVGLAQVLLILTVMLNPIGNASIRRLVNVVEMEHSTSLLQITNFPYSNGCHAMGTYNWNGCEGRASRPQVVPASAHRCKADTCPDRQAPPLAEIPEPAVAIVPVPIGNHPSDR